MKTLALPLVSAAVLAVAVASIVRTQPQRSTEPPPLDPPQSRYLERVAAAGLVEPCSENLSLGAHLSGIVDTVWVQVGQDVRRGQPLVTLDTRALDAARIEQSSVLELRRAEVETAKARSQRAAAALAEARQFLRYAESVSDPGSISVEELTRRRTAVEIASAELATAEAGVVAAEASVRAAESGLARITTDLARSTVTAPIDGRILQLRIRPGEFAAAGPGNPPWLVLGDVSRLHVRVDIDEHEAWRFRPGAAAVAQVRGNARQEVTLEFVRLEPLVIPKQSLTGSSTERVDTRVLQALYRVEPGPVPLFVGQQMDVFIESAPPLAGVAPD